ncbi:hypothetical protein RvY_17664 [Ramazzottius varieornatus]|uniref:CUE domain-containing protein n=1 Tax=Ramazzottius varieornatus TaxID=947166 RepID=A0A1D1W523_RAMVA|nr:hypothetical protein RvY_17664 [Ramazzottius varieornatus]
MDNEREGSRRRNFRQMAVLDVPEDFLRIPTTHDQRLVQQDHELAAQLAAGHSVGQQHSPRGYAELRAQPALQGRLSVTVAQAKLGKNYGLTRMDPYVRIRIGHYVFESETDPNGATNPRWDKTFTCYLPPGINSVYVEIFDERTFSTDERIAWGHFTIPPRVFEGDALDDWWQLSGKQGDQKEGMIEMVFSYQMVQVVPYVLPSSLPLLSNSAYSVMPGMPVGHYPRIPATGVEPTVALPAMPTVTVTEEDIKQVKEMFPSIEDDIIKSVLEEKHNNKSAAINSLLAMADAT